LATGKNLRIERIVPTGLYAFNRLGFSTQVPANAVYLTDGSPRRRDVSGNFSGQKSVQEKKN